MKPIEKTTAVVVENAKENSVQEKLVKQRPRFAYIHVGCSGHAFYLHAKPRSGEPIQGFDYEGNPLKGEVKCKSCGAKMSHFKTENIIELK
ncbi:MAG TPA: hypothetical protein VD999_05715 [Vitreimonas sp.]|nr:hypothetical protein [Vitreimonas sp.]